MLPYGPAGFPEFYLHVLLVGLSIAMAVALWRAEERRLPLWVMLAVFLTAIPFATVIGPNTIPIGLMTPLQEGGTEVNVYQLYPTNGHNGMVVPSLGQALFGGPAGVSAIQSVVHLNLWLWVVNAVLFAVIAFNSGTNRWWAGVCWGLFCFNRITVNATFSELASVYLTTLFLVGVIACHTLWRNGGSAAARLVALAVLLVICPLVQVSRVECLVVAGLAVALGLPQAFAPDAYRRATERFRLMAATAWQWGAARSPRLRWGAAAILIALVFWKGATLERAWFSLGFEVGHAVETVGVTWFVNGLYPFDSNIVHLYEILDRGAGFPLGVTLLAGLGALHALRRGFRFMWLPVSLWLLYKTYLQAGHDGTAFYEGLRYATVMMGPLCFLMLFGPRELRALAQSFGVEAATIPTWAKVGLTMVALVPPNFIAAQLADEGFLLDRNQQREVQALIALTQAHESCVFLAPTWFEPPRMGPRDLSDPKYDLMVFGAPLFQPHRVPLDGPIRGDEGLEFAPTATCVMLYTGLDCNLEHTDCDALHSGGAPIWEQHFEDRRYTHEVHAPPRGPDIALRLHQLSL